jgi:hypothetical protein
MQRGMANRSSRRCQLRRALPPKDRLAPTFRLACNRQQRRQQRGHRHPHAGTLMAFVTLRIPDLTTSSTRVHAAGRRVTRPPHSATMRALQERRTYRTCWARVLAVDFSASRCSSGVSNAPATSPQCGALGQPLPHKAERSCGWSNVRTSARRLAQAAGLPTTLTSAALT